MKKHEAYIKAYTSFGGDEEQDYTPYFTEENEQAFDSWLNEQPKINGATLYRGYKFDAGYFSDSGWEEGAAMLPLHLTEGYHPAFTNDELRAVRYINDFGNATDDYVKVLFELRTSGKYMVDVSALSVYPCEGEHHCTNDARFKVISIKRTGGFNRIILEEI